MSLLVHSISTKKMQQRNWQQIIKCPLVIWMLNLNVFITLNKFYFYSFSFCQATSMLYRQFSTKKQKQHWTSYSDSNAKQRMIVNERYQQYDRNNPMKKNQTSFLLVPRSKFSFASFILNTFVAIYYSKNLCVHKNH